MRDHNKQCHKKVKTRRGLKSTMIKHNVNTKPVSHIKMFSTNGASVKNGKGKSLNAEVTNTQANIVTVQEMHYLQKGRFKMDTSFVLFEAIRKKKCGGTMIACHKDLNPKLIEEYNEEFELLVVEVETEDNKIRIISGYGPQENWDEDDRIPFFLALEVEIEKAELAGKSIIIEMDANSKLGPKYVPGDPHGKSPNGALLADIIERHNLIVGNGSKKCTGIITRCRVTKTRTEKSVIDFLIFSDDLKKHFKSMHIDEERKHVLTRIKKTKKGTQIKESDHNVLISEFNCKVMETKHEKTESYNLRNKECQAMFKTYTTNTKMLSSTIDDSEDIDRVTERLLKKIDGCIAINFKKIRIKTQAKDKTEDELYNKMKTLKTKDDSESKKQLDEVVEALAEIAENNYKHIKTEMSKVKQIEGKINGKELWKLKKRLCPKSRDPQCAMLDSNGNILTSDEAIQNRALEVYSKRLEANEMKENLKDLENDTNTLCEIRLKLTEKNKTEPWTMDDLKFALKHLESDKSRDPEGYANELFKESVAGDDLLLAVLKLMNMIKEKQKYPQILEKGNITSIYKKKSRNDFKNYRGVFRVQILRSILDRLTYNDSY